MFDFRPHRHRKQSIIDDNVCEHARRDFICLLYTTTVYEAIETIRHQDVGQKIIYFYVVDENHKLTGVIPTRRLIVAAAHMLLCDIMVPSVVSIPCNAKIIDAYDYFVKHKFLSFPVVDDQGKVVGVLDVTEFTGEVFDHAEREQANSIFELLGFKVSQLRRGSPFTAFRYRFPWLLATIASGSLCALIAGVFETTLSESMVLAFFLALVLGLGESVSTQTMTLTIQALRAQKPSGSWFFSALLREFWSALLLGLGCGSTVAAIVYLWKKTFTEALVIGGSISLSLVSAGILGLLVPWSIHRLKLDPKIAAGPLTLAVSDIFTLVFYFGIATLVL